MYISIHAYKHTYMHGCAISSLARFIEHELIVEKEAGTIEWKARKSIQQKEAQQREAKEQEAATRSKESASATEQEQTEKGSKDIRLLEMGGEEASTAEAKTGKHEYTHHLRYVACA